jgi:DNA-directed RNA polymerase
MPNVTIQAPQATTATAVTMAQAAMNTAGKFRTRFEDADEVGFLAAASSEIDEVIHDFRVQQAIQKSINRKVLVSACKKQMTKAGDENFGFGVFLDWRGRLYYHGVGVAPQGKDMGRGLLEAAEGARLGISGLRHLMAGVATTWGADGIDKASIRERVAYVRRMLRDGSLARIVAEAQGQTGYTWRLAEEPVQFLALAVDLLAAVARKAAGGRMTDHVSHQFVGYDATCSGIQILAAATGDVQAAGLVNVVPRADGKRADIYMAAGEALSALCTLIVDGMAQADKWDADVYMRLVADAEAEILAARAERRERDPEIMGDAQAVPAGDHWAVYWAGRKIGRSLMKKPVMVYCYGGGKRTFAGAIREDSGAPWKACMWLAATLYDRVLPTLLPRSHAFMLALQNMARTLAKAGRPVQFTAADGLPFVQATMESESDKIRCHLVDGRSPQIVIKRRGKALSAPKQVSGIAPNIVHHWDALFLRNVVRALAAAGIRDFFTVHDCFYLRAGDWARGWKIIRAVFAETFSGDVARAIWQQIEDNANGLQQDAHAAAWAADTGAEYGPAPKIIDIMSECPVKGDLDLSGVMRSEFLFS